MPTSTKLDTSKDYIKSGDSMKKYMISIFLGLLIGFFLGKSLLEEYSNFHGVKSVASNGVEAYFIKYGQYKTLDEIDKATISLTNYIYTEKDDQFSVYIGMTTDKENLKKLVNYFNGLGLNCITPISSAIVGSSGCSTCVGRFSL